MPHRPGELHHPMPTTNQLHGLLEMGDVPVVEDRGRLLLNFTVCEEIGVAVGNTNAIARATFDMPPREEAPVVIKKEIPRLKSWKEFVEDINLWS